MMAAPDTFDRIDRETPPLGFLSRMAALGARRLDFDTGAAPEIDSELIKAFHTGILSRPAPFTDAVACPLRAAANSRAFKSQLRKAWPQFA